MNKEKIFIIAGEDSGDLHGAKLIESIKNINPSAEFFGVGGNRMQAVGLTLTEHIKNLNVIGIFEVVKHYSRIKKILFSICSARSRAFAPAFPSTLGLDLVFIQ